MSHKLRDKITRQCAEKIEPYMHIPGTTRAEPIIAAALDEYAEGFKAELSRAQNAYSKVSHEVEQILGKVLGYPELFPQVSEVDDGSVCVGDHVPQTLACEAASKIRKSEINLEKAREAAESLSLLLHELEEKGVDLTEIQEQTWSRVTATLQEISDA